jgi:hypothetical protein
MRGERVRYDEQASERERFDKREMQISTFSQ